ncbi:hypothetical protein Ocin01_00016 [Orchesella cincta]|uniref:Uncharacterized protein n=1 Tax=Orchesella cincta TaxID=48709 RepID=A0A1D2NN54_ORCCI|nr:hypothetical protein Ocin01_00016 [Orchesella cincta]
MEETIKVKETEVNKDDPISNDGNNPSNQNASPQPDQERRTDNQLPEEPSRTQSNQELDNQQSVNRISYSSKGSGSVKEKGTPGDDEIIGETCLSLSDQDFLREEIDSCDDNESNELVCDDVCDEDDGKTNAPGTKVVFQTPDERKTYKFDSEQSFEEEGDLLRDNGCDFCATVCGRPVNPSELQDRPSWIKFFHAQPNYYRSKCQWMMNQHRLRDYLYKKDKRQRKKVATSIIVDDKGHLFPSWKQVGNFEKRPLWGLPTSQWDFDERNGKHGYRMLTSDPPETPLPTFFRAMPPISEDICVEDDANILKKRTRILVCRSPFCARKVLRRVNRDYRGKMPKGVKFGDLPPGEVVEDPLIKKLMEEMQKVFVEFLARKVPIIWIYGRPIKSVAEIRRRHCIQLAESHKFTYISLDEEVALLAAKGSKAIEAGNPYFEGFSAVERLAIPVCIKLVQDQIYSLNRFESLELLKFLMLQYWPTNGYVIDGFPWDDKDNEDFEKTFYPISAGIYFLDSKWTTDKTETPEVLPPLYFKRNIKYDENLVETACGNFGLKTIKIINCETLDEEMSYAVNAVVDEYLDAYDEVLEGNDDVLRDNDLELEKFGETVGYGLDLGKYMKPKPKDGQEHLLELDKLKEMGWDGIKGKGEYTSAIFDAEAQGVKVTPSKRKVDGEGDEGKDADGGEGDGKKEHGEEDICPEDDEECKKKREEKKRRRRRKHCCKCCKCHIKGQSRKPREDSAEDGGESEKPPKGRRRRHHRRPSIGSDDDDASDDGKAARSGRRKGKKVPKAFDDSHSEPDHEMGDDGPFVYDKKWGFRAIRRAGKHPDVRIPRITTPSLKTSFKEKESDIQRRAAEGSGVYALPQSQSHQIPDPYNTLPHRAGDKPGDYLHDYPGPRASERFSKINRKPITDSDKLSGIQAPTPTTPYAEEPTSGLRALFSDTMSRIIAKNQADIRKIKYDKLKHKVAQVEYEIYQDDYRLPKYRFYKTYKDYTPEDFIKERQNWIPCADCFDSFKQAEQFHRGEQLANLSHIEHDRYEQKQEHDHQYGKGPLFNRMVSCLCGEDNEAGFHIPGFKPDPKIVDNSDIERFNQLPNYKKRKP